MINPSEICLDALPSVALQNKSELPAIACIYFAIDSQGVVQYIGRSVNSRARWMSHHRYKQFHEMGGIKIAYLQMTDSKMLAEVEAALINWFQPPLNGSPVVGVKKKFGATRRTFNIGNDLYRKLHKVAYKERVNATQQLERALDYFFADYERENNLRIDDICLTENPQP